jgi:hypothetical protein
MRGMINMKKEKTNMNRWFYVLIIFGVLVAVVIRVYALAPGVIPNPGHNISEVSIPSGCVANQFLKYDGTKWVCASVCPSGTHLINNTYSNGVEDTYGSWGPVSCPGTDTCDGSTSAYTCLAGESRTCTDVYKFFSSGGLGGWVCNKRTVTCKKAAILCGE